MDGLPKRFRDNYLDTWRSGGTSRTQKYCREIECRRQRRRGGKGGLNSMKSDGKHGRDCISPKRWRELAGTGFMASRRRLGSPLDRPQCRIMARLLRMRAPKRWRMRAALTASAVL